MPEMLENKIKLKKFDIYSFIIIIFAFGLDRISKIYVINLIQNNDKEIYVNNILNITLNWNTGIGFGLLSLNAGIQYHIVSALILLIIVYLIFLMTKGDILEKFMFALIIGGAAGNLFDRLTYYAVPDFIDFHIENYHWFTFNVADIFITIGIVFIILREIFFGRKYE